MTTRTASANCHAITLADGRRLVFTTVGPLDGAPVIYCHGAIGTPVEGTVDVELMAQRLRVRYIAPFRPGVGGSDPLPGRTVLDHADDLHELADALGLDTFNLVGVSAGAPYALAAAHRLGPRVNRVALCSAVSPFFALHRTPGMRRRVRAPLAALLALPDTCKLLGDAVLPLLAANPAIVTRVIAAHSAAVERDRLAVASEHTAACSSFLDATAAGASGLIDDYLTYARGWGFDVSAVEPEVDLWHGANDPLVPVEQALALAAALPRCRVFIDPDQGHHFFRSALEQILEVLTAGAGGELRASRTQALAA